VATRGGVSTPQDSGPSGRCSPLRYQPNLVSNATICRLDTRRSNPPALPAHYLGHKNIQRTVRYTEMAPDRLKDFWRG